MIVVKIDKNVVVNSQVVSDKDEFDPNYIWVDVSDLMPQPSVGWGYDGGKFYYPETQKTNEEVKAELETLKVSMVDTIATAEIAAEVVAEKVLVDEKPVEETVDGVTPVK